MLEIKTLTCGYDRKKIVSDVTFFVNTAELFGIIGPNGSGKTTLLRAISRILRPMHGSVMLEGQNIWDIPLEDFARRVAVVSQLLPMVEMTVEEFVLLGRIPHFQKMQLMESKEDHKAAHRAMELTEINHLKDRQIQQLSGGERQLAQIARALAQTPSLLLLDEPTAHLDIAHQVAILDLLKRLVGAMKLTVIMVLHDLNLASEYCDRLALMSKGGLYKVGKPEQIIDYKIIEEVYQTVVVVEKNPISSKPHVLIVSKEELQRYRSKNPV